MHTQSIGETTTLTRLFQYRHTLCRKFSTIKINAKNNNKKGHTEFSGKTAILTKRTPKQP